MKRIVDTAFWDDNKVVEEFSPEDKYFMLYLMTNPHSTQLGIYQVATKTMAFEMGYSAEAVKVLIDRFATKYGIIDYDTETNEIAIKNYLVYSIVKGGDPILEQLKREAAKVKSDKLRAVIYDHLQGKTVGATVEKFLPFLIENINANAYANAYARTEGCTQVRTGARTQGCTQKHKYGEFGCVLLSDDELEKLKAEFPADWSNRIKAVDEYCASHGKRYKNYLATIRAWERNEKKKEAKKPEGSFDTDDFFEASLRRVKNGK